MQGAGGVGGLLHTTAHSTLPTHHYPLYDGNGNITAYITNTCAIAASFDYDPFGNIINNNNPLNFPYAFSTKPRETETGLYYYGYRWYDPLTGRWPSRDPIEERGGVSLYGFVRNKSVKLIDVLGNGGADTDEIQSPEQKNERCKRILMLIMLD
jgi:RHS repeat-associated protein